MPHGAPSDRVDESFLTGGGQAGALMRTRDWSDSALGPPGSWPQSLRSVVGLLLSSKFPMFVAWGPELGFLYNDAYAEILGAKHPAAMGRRFREIWSEIWSDIAPLIEAALAGEAIYRENMPLLMNRRGFDEQTWFTFSYSPARDESGRVAGLFCACTETTANIRASRSQDFRLRLEECLRDGETPQAALDGALALVGQEIGAARCTFSEVDDDGTFVDVVGEWHADGTASARGRHRIADFGQDRVADLLSGQALRIDDVSSDPRTAGSAAVAAYAALGCRASLDLPLLRNGRVRALLGIGMREARRWTDADLAIAREAVERTWQAAERLRAETRLGLNEAHYRALFETIDEGFCIIEFFDGPHGPLSDYVHVEANPAYTANAGIPDIVGQKVREMVPDEADAWVEIYRRVLVTGEPVRFERELVATGRHLELAAFRVEPVERRQVAVLFKDVTARKRAEAQLRELNGTLEHRVAQAIAQREQAEAALRQSQKMEAMGQLTGGVAHDFNNLLTPIVASLDMLQRRGLGGEREQRLIAGAVQAAERAKLLVQRLLAFARRQPLQPVPVDVGRLVVGMSDLVASTTGPQIKVVVDVQDDLPSAHADPNQLEMALLNLAVNARDAMPDGGTLRISARAERLMAARGTLKPGAYVRLSVADTGAGMDEQTLRRAIEPFFSTKGIGKGTGLGLSMVHGLASQLGGALSIASQPRLGTNVELWLPQTDVAPEPRDATRIGAPPSARRGTALVVDDDQYVRLSTTDMLIDLGYAVVEAESAEQALRMIDQHARIELVVTDHLMPGMSGTDLAREIRSARPGLPVLLISGYAELEGVEPGLPRLAKPFRKDELAASLAAMGVSD